MSDDNQTQGSKPTASFSASGFSASPAGHSLRRAVTIDDSAMRRRPTLGHRFDDANNSSSDNAAATGTAGRRSSNFSDYSLSEARGLLNPAVDDGTSGSTVETSSLAGLSLAFALLPALAGSLFKNGSAVVTDVMLLGLAGVFLHWSVTQPWKWYHSAQQVRAQHQSNFESVIEEDSDSEAPSPAPVSSQTASNTLEHVPEESESDPLPDGAEQPKSRPRGPSTQQQAALRELYRYEILSLLSCLAFPLISAYLLHAIRSQLSRPSEGLVSNYNLTIFLLVSELRVFSHMIKLFQSRTLHLQRVVHANPYGQSSSSGGAELDDLLSRLQRLESRSTAEEALIHKNNESDATRSKQEAGIARDVRNTIQPELDALNRAVRRYEKKATLLQLQTESRFAAVDARVEDAIALAAAAAKNSASQKNIIVWTLESAVTLVLLPFQAIINVVLLPLRTLLALVTGKKQKEAAQQSRPSRSSRSNKPSGQGRYSGDRVPSRVAKR